MGRFYGLEGVLGDGGGRDKFFPGFGVLVSCKRVFIIFAFLFGLIALIAPPSLRAEIRVDDSGPAEGSAAGTSENKPDSPASISSRRSSVPAGSPTLKPPAKVCGALQSTGRGCSIERKEFFSDACDSQMTYYAFVPKNSKEADRYPVLYLLHGAFDSYTAWKDHAENIICELVSEYRIIIVTPEGRSFGWYADSRLVKNNQIETYFIKELIPDVEKSFPTNGRCSIAGLSMGGHGAFVLCLRHPGVFLSVSSMSGILDITRHKNQWHLAEVFGPYKGEHIADWEEHSALKLLERSADQIRSLPMLITVSKDDQLSIDDNRLVHRQLEKMNLEHLYYESPGVHDWAYWTSQLPLHVSFHACWLKSMRPPGDSPQRPKDAH
jgi:S-formylglutathione hydrolase FrmB